MGLTSGEIFQIIFGLGGGVVSVLLIVIAFFLRKLVHKVDLIDAVTAKLSALAERLDSTCEKVDDLCGKVESLGDLRIEVATLRERFLTSLKTRHGGNGEIVEEDLQ